MQQLNHFLQHANYEPVFRAGAAALSSVLGVIVLLVLLHTLHLLGRQTPLYRHKKPVKNWNKRFYSASFGMIVALLILIWLVGDWSAHVTP